MAYTKRNPDGSHTEVSEEEHIKEFLENVPKVKPYGDGVKRDIVSHSGGTGFAVFSLVLGGQLRVPDSIYRRVEAAVSYQLMNELEKVESTYEPKKCIFRRGGDGCRQMMN